MNQYSIVEQVDIGTAALSRGDNNKARSCFLTAAHDLLSLAKNHHGQLRQSQIDQANKLWKQAQHLDSVSGQTPSNPLDIESFNDTKASQPPADLSLDDVVGLDSVKKAFKAKFIYPLQDPENAKRYKQSGAGGILLYGPPGTGKTFLVRALASELGAPIFIVKPDEIMDQYVGGSEQKLAAVFEDARQHPLSLIFIDEIDALAPSRTDSNDSVTKRLVPQLLAELDGFTANENKILFLGATNYPWLIDKAIMRPGRFDELCYVGLPNQAARCQILSQHLDGVPIENDIQIDDIAKITKGYSAADLFGLCMKVTQSAYIELMETGNARYVNQNDFESTIASTPILTTQEILDRYQNFSNMR